MRSAWQKFLSWGKPPHLKRFWTEYNIKQYLFHSWVFQDPWEPLLYPVFGFGLMILQWVMEKEAEFCDEILDQTILLYIDLLPSLCLSVFYPLTLLSLGLLTLTLLSPALTSVSFSSLSSSFYYSCRYLFSTLIFASLCSLQY